jgi:hypothetical protein
MTRRLIVAVCLFATFSLAGCGGVTPDTSTEVQVTGSVTNASGAAVKDVELMFQPVAGTARQATFTLKADGKFSGTMTTGKYTYFFNELSGKAAAFNAIPAELKRGSQERVIEVKDGQPVDLKVQ